MVISRKPLNVIVAFAFAMLPLVGIANNPSDSTVVAHSEEVVHIEEGHHEAEPLSKKDKVDAYVFLGQSNFHAAGIALSTNMPTYVLDPYFNEHPGSKSWLPLRKSAPGVFSSMIDLGDEHYIELAMLHDMRNTADLDISIGTPGNWTSISTYTTSQLKVWQQIDVQLTTRYIQLTMTNTIDAQINEIALYGYILSPQKRTEAFIRIEEQPDYNAYPNPAKDRIFSQHHLEQELIFSFAIGFSFLIKLPLPLNLF